MVLQGLRVRHSSPSIANNYAVRLVVSADAWVLKRSLARGGLMFGVVCSRTGLLCLRHRVRARWWHLLLRRTGSSCSRHLACIVCGFAHSPGAFSAAMHELASCS